MQVDFSNNFVLRGLCQDKSEFSSKKDPDGREELGPYDIMEDDGKPNISDDLDLGMQVFFGSGGACGLSDSIFSTSSRNLRIAAFHRGLR